MWVKQRYSSQYDENFIEENGYLYHGADVSVCLNSSSSSSPSSFKPVLLKHEFFRDIYLIKTLFVKSACDEIYCHNGGTCQSGFTVKGYRCLCPSGYTGERCEKGKKSATHDIVLIFFMIQILGNK